MRIKIEIEFKDFSSQEQAWFNTHLGSRMKFFRKRFRITQLKMGKYLGLHQAAVSRVEAGEQELTAYQKHLLISLRNWE